MDSMVERVARAIAVANGCSPTAWKPYVPHARAAIEAMREPTEAMFQSDVADVSMECAARSIWQNMIDAALAEKPED